jgi:hypothetical protein
MSTIKQADSYLDRMAAKAAANPSKAAIYQAKVDAKIATWIAAGRTVTNDGATITSYTIPTSSSGGGSSSTGTTGQTFNLTGSVDSIPGLNGSSGSAGVSNNDTIQAVIGGGSSTFSLGDSINAGSGTDVLNIIAISGTSTLLTSLDAVETVNVRLLDDNDVGIFDAQDWSGVSQLTNASSLAESTLRVTGLADSTTVVLHGNTDINVGFDNTATGATANAVLVSAGSAGTATTIGSAGAGTTAHFDFDFADTGFVTHVNLEVRGSVNIARLEAGSNVTSVVVTGTGNASLVTDDTITSFNASAAAGSLDITFSGASDVAVVGGAGNDTFNLGTTLSNGDSVGGGAGTDVVNATVAGFNRSLNASGVESATITFTGGGELNVTGSTITSYSVSAGAAGVSAAFNGLANSATVALTNDDLGGVTLDFASGATVATINIGSAVSATADVELATLAITDVASVTINAVAGLSAATADITTATFDTDVKAIVWQTLGSTGLAFEIGDGGNASIGGATAITFNANFGNIDFDSTIAGGSTLTTVNVNTLGGVSSTAGSATLVGIGGTAITTINLVASGAGDIEIGGVTLGNGASAVAATATINVSQTTEQDTTIGAISTTGGMALTINAPSIGSSGSLAMADITIAQGSSTAMAMGVTFNAITIGTGASFELDGIDLEGSATGAQVTIGTITMNSGASLDFGSASGISADGVGNVDVSSITLVMGASATANFGAIKTTAGAVGNITVTLGDGATATFGAVSASSIGSHSLVLASGASASFGNMQAYSGAGNANQGAKGAISIGGVDGSDVSFGTIQASAVGSVSVSGALDVTIGLITTTTLGEVNATGLGVSGSFTINMGAVTNAVEVKLGAGANTITSGIGNDVITLLGGRTSVAGNDVIRYTTATQGIDYITGFIAGNAASGGDRIEFGSGGGLASRIIVGSGLATDASTLVATVATTASGAITVGSGDSIVLINATAFGSTAAFHSAIATGGSLEINMAGGGSAAAGNLVVVWTDGSDSYVSLVAVEATAGANALVSGVAGIVTLSQLAGVTPAALVAANFDIV